EPGVFDGVIYGNCENILGDIIICADRVIAQAEEYGHSQKRELAFLIVHSMLHLVGYDHMNDEDGDLMRAEEKRLMGILGIQR
ncbi:MAG: rRNA maturation RNase YbeY, partial [Lachnospiraceae bacterium]|nr:rRNA maturation RNase YbeY [Lachnospiraceae bacterium]